MNSHHQVQQKQPKVKPNPRHLNEVSHLSCCACGSPAPSEAHHCRDIPDYEERDLYDRLPGAALKSADMDTIPLCPPCHWMFHNRRSEFHAAHGKDYYYIQPTRLLVAM